MLLISSALLQDTEKIARINLLETESFESTFGNKKQRKRPKLAGDNNDYGALLQKVINNYNIRESMFIIKIAYILANIIIMIIIIFILLGSNIK